MKEDWSADDAPPAWLGQQAGCFVAAFVGAVGVAFLAVAVAVLWALLRGGL